MSPARLGIRAHRLFHVAGLGIAVLVLAVGCGSGTSSPSGPSVLAAQHNLAESRARRITAFGDSITVGILELARRDLGLTTSNNYPALLERKLRTFDPTWTVLNRGRGGEETVEGVARLPGVLAVDRPGIVLLMEGSNDARKCWSADEAVQNLRSMVQLVKDFGATPVIATVPPTFTSRECTAEVIAYANQHIRALASAEHVVLAEIFAGMNSAALFGQDHLHPNERGYAVMADIWFQALQRVTQAGGTVAQRRQR